VPNLPLHRVAILTSHFSTGDAVSNDVVGMCDAFLRQGYEARMYAGSWDSSECEILPVAEVRQFLQDPGDLLIYHYSIEWNPGMELLQEVKCRTAIKYHNVTPPEFFVGVSAWHEEKCRVGREELKTLARTGCDIYLADSEYNRQDLLKQGVAAEKCFVVPPFHHTDHLRAIASDLDVLDAYRDGKTNILMVGRISPNKGHSTLIEAFSAYHHDYNRDSRLLIVGKEEEAFAVYSKRLREIATFLLTEDAVLFTGEASMSELKAYYLLANVFAIASEHEGFCVPLVEAMAMKVPIVAYASTAIPATVGGAGVILNERRPRLMAEAINRISSDESLTVAFGMKGWQRYERHFTSEKIGQELFRSLEQSGIKTSSTH
jgi:glycosyltransferase involved in cell wall biosynthesis